MRRLYWFQNDLRLADNPALDDALRRELCEYVVACATRDAPTMERLGLRFAGPLHRYFPLLLSPWFIFGARLSADGFVPRLPRERSLAFTDHWWAHTWIPGAAKVQV